MNCSASSSSAIHSADGAKVPGVSSKVIPCSPLAASDTLLVGVSLDYPLLLRLALPNTLHARISFGEFFVRISMRSF